MKLLSFYHENNQHLGCLWGGQTIVDLKKAYTEYINCKHKKKLALDKGFPVDLLSFIHDWEQTWPYVSTVLDWLKSVNDPELLYRISVQPGNVKIHAPMTNPSKVVCIGLNYRDHCREHNFAIPERPLLFSKFPTSITGPYDEISWSKSNSQQVDYEGELAIIIKKTCWNVAIAQASDYIAGYTVLNDISARDVQSTDVQWVRGKSFDTFCPYGPYLTTTDEVPEPQNLAIRSLLNDQLVQNSNTSEMIFSCFEIVSFISKSATLLPGDLIATGTPDGVGSGRNPQVFLHNGDTLRVEIEGLGWIQNKMRILP
jgi:2-keto-4-pentenoate hydratase/2-oxohepta-3-ene-1,7-dioic acid hydratase in catechol pathway